MLLSVTQKTWIQNRISVASECLRSVFESQKRGLSCGISCGTGAGRRRPMRYVSQFEHSTYSSTATHAQTHALRMCSSRSRHAVALCRYRALFIALCLQSALTTWQHAEKPSLHALHDTLHNVTNCTTRCLSSQMPRLARAPRLPRRRCHTS